MTLGSWRRQQPKALETSIQFGLIILVALMPFHAFLSVWLGTLYGHRAAIQSWKELLLIALALATVALVIREPQRLKRWRQPGMVALLGFTVLALLITAWMQPAASTALFGAKIDLEFIVAFLIGTLAVGAGFSKQLLKALLVGASLVVAFCLAQVFLLPPDFLTLLGYGPTTVLPYQHLDASQTIFRFASTLGGPNQLGTYLIIPLAIGLAIMLHQRRWWLTVGLIAGLVALFHTYSRGAWIGAGVAAIIVVLGLATTYWRRLSLGVLGGVVIILLALSPWLIHTSFVQHYVFHGYSSFEQQKGSDFEHLASLTTGTNAVLAEPLGHGLGTAGPAVFQTGSGRIIENYYLQLGYETGITGMLLFVTGIVLIGWRLWQLKTSETMALGLAAALAGISVNALVLPAWTDSTGALVFWILAGAMLGLHPSKEIVHVKAD